MYAAIDVGSNTVRMLAADCRDGELFPELYRQKITRLAGGFSLEKGLAAQSIDRTFKALVGFSDELRRLPIDRLRMVGTAALRRAENAGLLLNQVKLKTGISLEIINGDEEARLSAAGVLSVLEPCPEHLLILDIGGGSTELIYCTEGHVRFSRSYSVGVVRLCEEFSAVGGKQYIHDMVVKFSTDLLRAGIAPEALRNCELCGTAGTVTTLAAHHLNLVDYDPRRVNNHLLSSDWLEQTLVRLESMSVAQREALPGIESGRGDLIMPGLELLIALCRYLSKTTLQVADAGLLEGILLDLCQSDRTDV